MSNEQDLMRVRFEESMSSQGEWPKAIEKNADGGYRLMNTAASWETWQDAWQAARQQAVPSDTAKRRALLFLDGLQQDGCNEVKTLRAALAAAPQAEQVVDPVVYWILYDDTGGPRFIKKSLDDGSLAVFDNEPDAKAAKRRHKGTDYRRVEYYTAPPTPDVSGLLNDLFEFFEGSGIDPGNDIALRLGAAMDAHQNREG